MNKVLAITKIFLLAGTLLFSTKVLSQKHRELRPYKFVQTVALKSVSSDYVYYALSSKSRTTGFQPWAYRKRSTTSRTHASPPFATVT